MKIQFPAIRYSVLKLSPNSSVNQILAVLVEVQQLEHWFDRRRSMVSISERIGVEIDHVEKLAAEVK